MNSSTFITLHPQTDLTDSGSIAPSWPPVLCCRRGLHTAGHPTPPSRASVVSSHLELLKLRDDRTSRPAASAPAITEQRPRLWSTDGRLQENHHNHLKEKVRDQYLFYYINLQIHGRASNLNHFFNTAVRISQLKMGLKWNIYEHLWVFLVR